MGSEAENRGQKKKSLSKVNSHRIEATRKREASETCGNDVNVTLDGQRATVMAAN